MVLIVQTAPVLTQLSTLKRAPKYTMCGRESGMEKKTLKRIASEPGPGQYVLNPKHADKFPKGGNAILGTSTREGGFKSMAKPGPATYTPDYTKSAGYHSSRRSRISGGKLDRSMASRAQTPGPGTYQIKSTLDLRPVSMTPRYKDNTRPTTPGPGAYETPRRLGGFTWKFPTSHREGMGGSLKNAGPGPGNYKLSGCINSKNPAISNSPNYSIVPKRVDLSSSGRMNTPGPTLNFTTIG